MQWRIGMRLEDWFHFYRAAWNFKVWILARWTNPDSLPYVGRRTVKYSYAPKPIDCKPKTADQNEAGKEQAGLVVDPTTASGAIRLVS